MPRIYIVFIGLLLITSFPPDIANSNSERDTKEIDFANVSIEKIAAEFRKVRKIKGHFDGEDWNDKVDKWMSHKHRIMIELGSRISGSKYKKGDVIKMFDQPDRIVNKGDEMFKQIMDQQRRDLLQKGYDPSIVPPYEFLVYYWRERHDFLFFTCLEDVIIHSGWWYAGE